MIVSEVVAVEELFVLIQKDGEFLVASALEFPIIAWDKTEEELQRKFQGMVVAYILCETNEGIEPFTKKKVYPPDRAYVRRTDKFKHWFDMDVKSARRITPPELSVTISGNTRIMALRP